MKNINPVIQWILCVFLAMIGMNLIFHVVSIIAVSTWSLSGDETAISLGIGAVAGILIAIWQTEG